MKRSNTKRAVAFWLSLALLTSTMPTTAFAAVRPAPRPTVSTTQKATKQGSTTTTSNQQFNISDFSITQPFVVDGSISEATLKSKLQEKGLPSPDPTGLSISYSIDSSDSSKTLEKVSSGFTIKKAGTAKIKATLNATGYDQKEIIITTEISKADISSASIEFSNNDTPYTGSEITPQISKVTLNGVSLIQNTDYTISETRKGTNAGAYDVTISGIGNYTNTATKKFNITKDTLTLNSIPQQTVEKNSATSALTEKLSSEIKATGVSSASQVTGTFTITAVQSKSSKNKSSDITKDNFTQTPGTYTLTATFAPTGNFAQNYNAKTNVTFDCIVQDSSEPQDKTQVEIEFNTDAIKNLNKIYDGNFITNPSVKKKAGEALSDGLTYKYEKKTGDSYSLVNENPKDAGTYKVTVTYETETEISKEPISGEFTISPKPLALANIQDIADQKYTGQPISPTLTIKDDEKVLAKDTDYTVTYENNTNVTTEAKAIVTYKGNYSGGPYTKNFKIVNADAPADRTLEYTVVAGENSLPIPEDVRKMGGTYTAGEATGTQKAIVKSAIISGDALNVTIDTSQHGDGAKASVPVTVKVPNQNAFTITYNLTVATRQQLPAGSIVVTTPQTLTFNNTYQAMKPATLASTVTPNGTQKWTYAVTGKPQNVALNQEPNNAPPSFKDVGTYEVTITYQDDTQIATTKAQVIVQQPAPTSTIKISASQLPKSQDDNYNCFNMGSQSGTNATYTRLNPYGTDNLVSQKVNGKDYYWIGMELKPTVNNTAAQTSTLYVSSSNSGSWTPLNKGASYSNFYIESSTGSAFSVWFDTNGDRSRRDSFYLATDDKGSNKFQVEVDFTSYDDRDDNSSNGSNGGTSTDKVDGEKVTTTTIDKTPSVKNDHATVEFSDSAIRDALKKNNDAAKDKNADRQVISLDVKTSKSVDQTTVTLPVKSLERVSDDDVSIELKTNHGSLTLDDRALSQIASKANKSEVDIDITEDKSNQYSIVVKDGSSDIIELGSGDAQLTFDYKLKSGEKASDVRVYRIGDGRTTWAYQPNAVYAGTGSYAAVTTGNYVTDMKGDYDSSKKKITFNTNALGTFLVTTDTLSTGGSSGGGSTTNPLPPITYPPTTFIDVPSSRWSAPYIYKLSSLGIVAGTGNNRFQPTLYVTREEFVKMLAGVARVNVSGYTSSKFPDVPSSRWSAPYIAWAASAGITSGSDGGRFMPTAYITREEMATMIYRYAQSAGKTLAARNAPRVFADANRISPWATTAVSTVQQAGIIDGNVTNGRYTFDPQIPASREESAKMLAVLYDLI